MNKMLSCDIVINQSTVLILNSSQINHIKYTFQLLCVINIMLPSFEASSMEKYLTHVNLKTGKGT